MKKLLIFVSFLTVFGIESLFSQADTTIQNTDEIKLAFGYLSKDNVVGAVDVISVDNITKSSDYNLTSTLVGQAAGLIVSKYPGGPGEAGASLKVRGRSRGGSEDNPLVVVDGIPNRSLNSIALESIESIVVLKDAVSKMLYGSKAANGVIVVTTKRGYDGKSKVLVSGEYGIKTPTFLPEYLNASDYVTLYNQAEVNDGKTSLTYSADDLTKYQDGSSPLHHPDVDYYGTFLKPNTEYQKANIQFIGGDEQTKYMINLGYTGEDGLEKVGESRRFNRFNVSSNLDYRVNDVLSMFLDIAGRFDSWHGPHMDAGSVFGTLSSHRPNDYPLFVQDYGDLDFLGYSSRVGTNLYGELTRKGYADQQNYYAQNTMGMNFELGSIAEGLSASGYISFDISNNIKTGKELSYSRVRVDLLEDGRDSLVRVGTDNIKGDQQKFDDTFYRNIGGVAKVNYNNTFGEHAINSAIVYTQQRMATKTPINGKAVGQDDKSINLGWGTNYSFDNRFLLEANLSLMGSDKFLSEERWGLYGGAGLGWIISNEDFLKDNEAINFLKLKGSWGKMGYDWNFGYYLYRDEYYGGGNYRFGPSNTVSSYGQHVAQYGNTLFTFEEATEINIGVETRLLNNKLSIEANYFNELRTGMPVSSANVLPDYFIGTVTAPTINYNSISNKGVDVALNYTDKAGDLTWSIGGNMIYSEAVRDIYSELQEYDHLKREGKPADAIWGYTTNGFYTSQQEIEAAGVVSSFSTLMPGDLRYNEIVEDGVIDAYDTEVIGNGAPRLCYAANINLEYKGFSLYALGQGLTGFNRMLTNSYYMNYGQRKYSVMALGAANPAQPESIANATHPRLTTENGGHSYKGSTFWIEDGSFFKLRVVELAYQLPQSLSKRLGAKNTKVFVKGNDVLTLSKNKDIEPENINAGINSYPMYSTVAFGLKLTF